MTGTRHEQGTGGSSRRQHPSSTWSRWKELIYNGNQNKLSIRFDDGGGLVAFRTGPCFDGDVIVPGYPIPITFSGCVL